MDLRKLFIGAFAFVIIILFYMMFSSTGSSKKKSSKAEVASLLLGGGSSSDSDGEMKRGRRVNNEKSLFDSDFGNAGLNNSYEEEDTGSGANPKGEVIPINPQTGKPYDEETMDQFEKLTLIFPENSLIPKRMTKEQKAMKDKEEQEIANASAAVINNTANRDQVKIYFEKQEKTVKDRLEIIEYLIDAQKEDGELDKDGQFQKILEGTKAQLKQVESSKEEAFRKFGL